MVSMCVCAHTDRHACVNDFLVHIWHFCFLKAAIRLSVPLRSPLPCHVSWTGLLKFPLPACRILRPESLIPCPVIKGPLRWASMLSCAWLDESHLSLTPFLPSPLSSGAGAARFICLPVSWLVRSLCQPCYWACWSVAINLCKGGEVLANQGFTQLSDEWLKARHLPQTVATFITDAVSKSWAVNTAWNGSTNQHFYPLFESAFWILKADFHMQTDVSWTDNIASESFCVMTTKVMVYVYIAQ